MTVFDLLDLPANFIVHGLLHELETVQVLDLASRAQGLAGLAHRYIGVAAERTLLHIAVANAYPGHDLVQLFGVGHGLLRGAHVGLGHNLQQRRARTVQVYAGLTDEVFVQGFARIFFQMGAH